jgi:arylsulfatase A-like enzyme/Tfp pilus assembly protein PilF
MRSLPRFVSILFGFLLIAVTSYAYDNVLVFTLDTLRADYLSCYGSTKVKTPHIDELAKNGVLFKNTVSPAPFTLPAHVSIFTGLLPPVHRVEDNGGFYLDKKVVTTAEVLKSKGMHTAAFVGAFPLDSRFGLDKGFDLYDDGYPAANNISEMMMPERAAEDVANSALKWMGGQTASSWFAWIHFYDAHFPYDPPDRFKKLYPNDFYAGEVAYVDEQVGRITAFLKSKGLDKKTLVVVVADHGESLGEHLEKTHGIFAYESTLRVPFIMSPFPARVVDTRVRLIDVAPTILELEKASFPGKIQGVSLVPYIGSGSKQAVPQQLSYFESLSMYLNAQWAPLRGFYSGDFQYISLPIPELYDLSKDPKEAKNLCEDKKLCSDWDAKFNQFAKPYLHTVQAAAVDKETEEQLRALGYVSGGSSSKKKQYGPQDDPKNLIVFHNRADAGLGFYNRGNKQKALEIFESIMQERPDYSVAYFHASFIQNDLGHPDQAAETMRQAIRNGVTEADAFGKLGLYLYEAGQYDDAIKQLKLALKEDPRDLDTLSYLGMAYTATGNFPEAESTFQKGLDLDPSDAMTINNLGTLYLTQKKLLLAEQQFKAALAKNPHIASAYNGLGVVYASQQKWDLAIQNWDHALQENGKNYDAMLNLAFAYLEKKDRGNALKLFQDFEQNAPPSRYAQDLAKVRSLIRQLQ